MEKTHLLLLFLLLDKMLPLGNILWHLKDGLDRLVDSILNIFQTWSHHNGRDGQDYVSLEKWWFHIFNGLTALIETRFHLDSSLDGIQRQTGA